MYNTWTILGILAAIGLLIFYKTKAAWGFFLLGIFIGFAIAAINYGESNSFDSLTVAKAAVLGGLAGVVWAISARAKNKSKKPHHDQQGVAHRKK